MSLVFDITFSNYGKYLDSNVFLQKLKKSTKRSFHQETVLPQMPEESGLLTKNIKKRSQTPSKLSKTVNVSAAAVSDERPISQGSSAFRSVTRDKTRGFCHCFVREANSEIKYQPKYDFILTKSPAFSIAKEHQNLYMENNVQQSNPPKVKHLSFTMTHNTKQNITKNKDTNNNHHQEIPHSVHITPRQMGTSFQVNRGQQKDNQSQVQGPVTRRRMSATSYFLIPKDDEEEGQQKQILNKSHKNTPNQINPQKEQHKQDQSTYSYMHSNAQSYLQFEPCSISKQPFKENIHNEKRYPLKQNDILKIRKMSNTQQEKHHLNRSEIPPFLDESRFNNFQFMKIDESKAHAFNSYTNRKAFEPKKQNSPSYDITSVNFDRLLTNDKHNRGNVSLDYQRVATPLATKHEIQNGRDDRQNVSHLLDYPLKDQAYYLQSTVPRPATTNFSRQSPREKNVFLKQEANKRPLLPYQLQQKS